MAKQAAAAEEVRLQANAHEVIAKLPWPMRFATLACGGSTGTVPNYKQRILELEVSQGSRTGRCHPSHSERMLLDLQVPPDCSSLASLRLSAPMRLRECTPVELREEGFDEKAEVPPGRH